MNRPATATGKKPVRQLAELVRSRASGILTATRGKHRRAFCLDRGRLALVVSNLIEEQLDEFLVREGLLTLHDRARLQLEASRAGCKLGAFLLEARAVPHDALHEAAKKRSRELLLSTLGWAEGQFVFEQGKPNIDGELVVAVSCLPLVLEHTRQHPKQIDEVLTRIGSPDTRPVRADGLEETLDGAELDPTARAVIEHSDGSLPLGELVERAGGESDAAWRALYGLLLVGAVRPARAGEGPRGRAVPDQVTRDEVQARISRTVDGEHYGVLGLHSDAPTEQIREAYYFLARRYHPDRFRSGELRDLLDEIETYFTQVTEAYNTLSDPELRRHYDEELESSAAGRKAKEPVQDTAYLAKQNFARGRLAAEKKQYRDAVTFLENAIQLDPRNAVYHLELGRVLALNPRHRQEAEERLLEATRLDPARVDGYLALGRLYEKIGRAEDAADMYREALSWEPGLIEATQRLAALGHKA